MMKFKKIRKLIVFDFDDTLAKTEAKIRITNKGLSLSSSEFARIKLDPEDELDLSDFHNNELLKPHPTNFLMNEVPQIIGDDSDILILTARSNIEGLEEFLAPHMPINRLKIQGGNRNFTKEQVAKMKRDTIAKLSKSYDEILFYDDSIENIEMVKGLKNPKIKPILIKTERAELN